MKVIKFKKGAIELDETGKILLGAILLLVLIYITYKISGGFSDQGGAVKDSFNTILN